MPYSWLIVDAYVQLAARSATRDTEPIGTGRRRRRMGDTILVRLQAPNTERAKVTPILA
jgi:hypothetical protein